MSIPTVVTGTNLFIQGAAANEMLQLFLTTATPGALNAKAHLFKNNIAPTRKDLLAGYTESAFPGYAAITIATWTTTIHLDGAGNAYAVATTSLLWTCTGGGTPEIAYGLYLTDSGGTILLAAAAFTSPQSMGNNGDTVDVTLVLPLQGNPGIAP